ncbi:hypothetical protein V5O48_005770 [Marasmius crinis-equi]|uniref:Uncharacterized protein n=1 Tax=Marasmius crinis-equi TaxID=585013 RepID=A0ABR3FLJ4_9AGAR
MASFPLTQRLCVEFFYRRPSFVASFPPHVTDFLKTAKLKTADFHCFIKAGEHLFSRSFAVFGPLDLDRTWQSQRSLTAIIRTVNCEENLVLIAKSVCPDGIGGFPPKKSFFAALGVLSRKGSQLKAFEWIRNLMQPLVRFLNGSWESNLRRVLDQMYPRSRTSSTHNLLASNFIECEASKHALPPSESSSSTLASKSVSDKPAAVKTSKPATASVAPIKAIPDPEPISFKSFKRPLNGPEQPPTPSSSLDTLVDVSTETKTLSCLSLPKKPSPLSLSQSTKSSLAVTEVRPSLPVLRKSADSKAVENLIRRPLLEAIYQTPPTRDAVRKTCDDSISVRPAKRPRTSFNEKENRPIANASTRTPTKKSPRSLLERLTPLGEGDTNINASLLSRITPRKGSGLSTPIKSSPLCDWELLSPMQESSPDSINCAKIIVNANPRSLLERIAAPVLERVKIVGH